MGLFNNPFSKNQSPAPGAMSTVPMDAPGVQPSVDADIRQADPKLRAGEHEKLSPDLQTRLQELRVDESTLVRGMKYEDLTLYEKKSVLVCSRSFRSLRSLACAATYWSHDWKIIAVVLTTMPLALVDLPICRSIELWMNSTSLAVASSAWGDTSGVSSSVSFTSPLHAAFLPSVEVDQVADVVCLFRRLSLRVRPPSPSGVVLHSASAHTALSCERPLTFPHSDSDTSLILRGLRVSLNILEYRQSLARHLKWPESAESFLLLPSGAHSFCPAFLDRTSRLINPLWLLSSLRTCRRTDSTGAGDPGQRGTPALPRFLARVWQPMDSSDFIPHPLGR
jgi:hypothetical protein